MMTTISAPTRQVERLRALAEELAARDLWSPEQLAAHRGEQLKALLAHAVSASSYYRESLGADAATGEIVLEQLPTLPKATLMREFDRIVTDPRLSLAGLERHLAGPGAGNPFLGEYRVFATSGSSGLRGIVVYSKDEFQYWIAAHLPVFGRMGISPSTRLAAIGAPNPIHLTRQLFAAFQREAAPRLDVTTPLPEMVAALNTYQPEALIGYPSAMALLAQEHLEGLLEIGPRIVGVGGEVLTREMRERIFAAWGVTPFQVYATTEAPIIAAGRPGYPGLHVFDDLVVIESVDENNRPVSPGAPGHKLLLSNLVNYVQPLIRYELTDSVTLAPGADPAGLPCQRIASIDGRSDDIIAFLARDGGEVAVHPYRLRAPFTELPEVSQYQVVHDGDALDVRVVLRATAPADTCARVQQALVENPHRRGRARPGGSRPRRRRDRARSWARRQAETRQDQTLEHLAMPWQEWT